MTSYRLLTILHLLLLLNASCGSPYGATRVELPDGTVHDRPLDVRVVSMPVEGTREDADAAAVELAVLAAKGEARRYSHLWNVVESEPFTATLAVELTPRADPKDVHLMCLEAAYGTQSRRQFVPFQGFNTRVDYQAATVRVSVFDRELEPMYIGVAEAEGAFQDAIREAVRVALSNYAEGR